MSIHIDQINAKTIKTRTSSELVLFPYEVGDKKAKANLVDSRTLHYNLDKHGYLTFIKRGEK